MREQVIKALITIAIQLLGRLIPTLGIVLGMPVVGWIAGIALSYLTSWLAKLIALAIEMKIIEGQVQGEVDAVNQATQEFFILKDQGAPKEKLDAARQKLRDSARKLISLK